MVKKNSFKMLVDAAKNCRHEMWKAVQVLLVITLLLSVVFYIVESMAQPEVYGGLTGVWNTIVWAFTQYIGDPGKFASNGPITFTGRLVATLIGIVKILIFAVPAGMIGSGFSKAIKDEKRQKELNEYTEKIKKEFRTEQCRHTKFRIVPRYKSLVSLQVNQNLTEDDVVDAIKDAKGFRLRNLADTYNVNDVPQDKLVVEIFPTAETLPLFGCEQEYITPLGKDEEKTNYGCKIDRQSNVTIVSTTSQAELGNSHFAYYLALYGGFNFVSREYVKEGEEDFSYYINKVETGQESKNSPYGKFIEDLKGLKSAGKPHWYVFILSVQRSISSQFSFVHAVLPNAQEGGTRLTTVQPVNEKTFLKMYKEVETMLANKDYPINAGEKEYATDLRSDLDECFGAVGAKNIAMKLGGGKDSNAFTIRIASEIIARNNRDIPLAFRLAEIMRENIGLGTKISDDEKKDWKK